MGGWGIITADVLVMASLAQIAALYTFHLWYASPSPSSIGVLAIGVAWIVVMTWICWVGIELSARIQQILLTIEVITLTVFAIVALVDVYNGSAGVHAIEPTASPGSTRSTSRASARSAPACWSASSSTGVGTAAYRSTRSQRTPRTAPARRPCSALCCWC